MPERKPTLRHNTPAQSAPRRRRRRRVSLYGGVEDRSVFLGNLTHSATPAANFYSLSLLAGLILCAALIFNSRALFILAAICAPFMAPLAGMSLAAVSGSARFFLHSLGGLLTGAVIVFCGSALGGFASRFWGMPDAAVLAGAAVFDWADILLLAAGAVFTAIRLYRNPLENPRLASAALAYELYLPLSVSAFALAAGVPGIFRIGMTAFVLRLTLAVLICAVVFDLQGLRLRLGKNSSWAGGFLITAIISIVFLAAGSVTRAQAPLTAHLITPQPSAALNTQTAGMPAEFTPQPSPPATSTATDSADAGISATTPPLPPTVTPTQQPSPLSTSTETSLPTLTQTATITPTPEPYMAVVRVSGAIGAYIRGEPAGPVVSSVLNGAWVEVQTQYPETQANDAAWVYIRTQDGIEGWMMKSLLDIRASTPQP